MPLAEGEQVRTSIRSRMIISMNLLVAAAGLTVGWVGAEVAGRSIERRLVDESVANASRLISEMRLPLSDALMQRMRQILEAELAAAPAEGGELISSSLQGERRAELNAKLVGGVLPRDLTLGGEHYRVGSALTALPGPPEQHLPAMRLHLLVPTAQLEAAKRQASRTIALLALAAIGVATAISLWLSNTICRPIRQLADRMDQLAARASEGAEADLGHSGSPGGGPAELARLAESFDQLLSRLREVREQLARSTRLATLGQVAASVAHELRNPLSGIKMNARVLADELAKAGTQDKSLDLIIREVERMDLYLQEMLSLAAGSPAQAEPPGVPVRLDVVADSVVSLLKSRCSHAGVTVERRFGSPVAVQADEGLVRQVVLNLMLNALDAMPDGGAITLTISQGGEGTVRMRVADTGTGVQVPEGVDIFEPFVTAKAEGVGLGLYVCRQIINRHGGGIGYDTSGQGSTFWFELPAAGAAEGRT